VIQILASGQTGLFKKKGVVKELPWNDNATTKELSQV